MLWVAVGCFGMEWIGSVWPEVKVSLVRHRYARSNQLSESIEYTTDVIGIHCGKRKRRRCTALCKGEKPFMKVRKMLRFFIEGKGS